jgi:uncharacterized damage-inducible protein DinB
MSVDMTQRVFHPLAATDPVIGRWLAALEDSRRRTKETLAGIAQDALDWSPPHGGNSIGTLLYHIALIEADYLYVDVLGLEDYPAEVLALFPYRVRDEDGRLFAPLPTGLDLHLHRLDFVRERALAIYGALTMDEFRRPRAIPWTSSAPGHDYLITPEWALHHLMQHEAEHRGEIATFRAQAEGGGCRSAS